MLEIIRKLCSRFVLLINRSAFHLLFKRIPSQGDYCNSKLISVVKRPDRETGREYLAFVRCGAAHQLIDDGSERRFDLALNVYAKYSDEKRGAYEYLIVGGLNKYMAACQFIDDNLLAKYKGFIFLDDDLLITYSELSDFLRYCLANHFTLAQPSLSRDSYYSHGHLLNVPGSGWRRVDMIEVMCPYFSREALKYAIRSFELSYSTWGLDYLWPALLGARPVVVDAFVIKHTKPVSHDGGFYKYMTEIGISPERELKRLKNLPLKKLRT